MTIEESLVDKLRKGLEMVAGCNNLDPIGVCISVSFKFDLYDIKDDKVLLPIGTKNDPVGLSTTSSDYLILRNKGTRSYLVKVETIKAFIRANVAILKKSIDENFKHMVIEMPLQYIDELSEKIIND